MSSESVKVVVRCRPMNEKEQAKYFERVVTVKVKLGQIIVKKPKETSASSPPTIFTFDSVYSWNSKQIDLYNKTCRPLVNSVLLGINGTIFAYGQTGTGKTYTMEGLRNDPESRGVIPNAFDHIFKHISRSQNQQYLVRASYLEIYQDEIRDLLSKDQSHRLELSERPDTGVFVKDLSSRVTKSVQEIEHVMKVGNQNRSVGATNMNVHSSRSHAIFVITVEFSELGVDGVNHIKVGKLNLVDLAGSERQAKTGAKGERLKEATKINQSLFALGNVMSALVDDRTSHIPYRDSKLTRLLQDSLGGNACTVMVANIGPASYNMEETLTTLRYSNRAKNIKNKPRINDDPKDAQLREIQEEVARLKEQLKKRSGDIKKKKIQRRAAKGCNGEDLEGETEDDDGDDNGDYWREQQLKLERERNAIMEDHSLVAEEEVQLLNEIEKKMEDLRTEREAGELIEAKVKAMESKLLVGGENIVDHTNEQQRMLQQRKHEIAEKDDREREMQLQMECRDEETLELKETFTSLQQIVNSKTKKLKKVFTKLMAMKAEIHNIQDAHIKKRQELEQNQYDLIKKLKLKHLIIENFIPPEKKSELDSRVYFDEEDEHWKLKPITPALKPPDYGRPPFYHTCYPMTKLGSRYKAVHIPTLKLDLPTRTTLDYQAPVVAPALSEALRNSVKIDDVVVIDASDCEGPASTISGLKKSKSGRSRAGKRSGSPSSPGPPLYPKCRGLVPR
ncbi:kinesin-like protein KIF3B [Platichthys flesus]|uniref:kinesin-like protein KIF3B n=1 Tax=Platichthys flesus TaxID=8260 RepID=UPI002DBE2C58|nr:kinesin-like protein KIF3B [Platichthys flesus]